MSKSSIDVEKQFGAQNYAPLPVVLTRGQGVYVWDDEGKRYLDMMSAYSAVSHGHSHPRMVKAVQEQVEKLCIVSRAFYTEKLGVFLKQACELTGFDKALAMNTGVEAVETGLKAAKKWAYKVKGVEKDKAEIIACQQCFHGRTTAVVGLSSDPQARDGFGPFPPGLIRIPYGDAEALEKAITPNTAAFLFEPIQGEGGIIVPPEGYLKKCEEICRKHNVLMLCDEIQTGLGRTGKLLAFHHEGIKPDGLMLGKALGGGMMPVSLFLSRKDVMDVFTPGDHGSTFGGNPLACVVGMTALDILQDENLTEKAEKMGAYFQAQLRAVPSKIIKEVRGRGLMIGLEIDPAYDAHHICEKLLEKGVLTKETHETVIRLAPPLIITEAQIDDAVTAIKEVLVEAESEAA